ncbi:MAG: hypothetical protein K6G24_07120 [Lachnospiraceae bacterium]|nr:hypothetical protein [Lachnospiraceae bacterium]
MSREETIVQLNRVAQVANQNIIDAVEMAIEALWQQPCEDCISRQEVINCVTSNEFRYKIVEDIKTLPSVTPKEKTGHWIFDEILDRHYYCSECKSMGVDYWDYCPKCGAKMVEPQESEG